MYVYIYTCLFSKCVHKITTFCSKTYAIDGSELCTVSVKVEKERVSRSVMRLVMHLFLIQINLPKPVMRKGRELKCCFTSTETVGLLGREPRTSTSTFTQLLSSEGQEVQFGCVA